ncbi:glucokinase regulatory [Labeo rohita]|uniref:Glucokinase regulatory n=1 Tax=Labeo rohita TaxID=84645 RepID=A0A498NQ32_LABRO|nr:glucokinase regulatory [Labeo rohita]
MNMDDLKQSCYELSLPVTEKCNPISRDIDKANGKQMVQILRRCDAEIFEKKINHDPCHQKLYNSSVIQTMVDVAKRAEMMLRTSFNEMLKAQKQKQICSYIIAGGDRALLTSQEAPEDDPALGARTLDKVCTGKKHVLFIGISCGMSAPFVAGQLDFCLKHLDVFTPVLLGFNPVHMARSEPMQDCSFHFKDVAERMTAEQRHKKAFVLNPVLGVVNDFDDIRGFINNGFSEMKNKEGDLSSLGPQFVIGHKDFVDAILPSLSPNDMILFLFTANDDLHEVTALADQVRRRTSNLHAIAHDLEKLTVPVVPTALVMIQCSCTLAEARHHLDCHPVIRDAVSACFSSSKNKSTVD